jgi:histone-lysine N-methyltransferase SETMAR
MDDLEKRFVIKYFFDEHKKSPEIFDILNKHYGSDAPCLSTVKYWMKQAKLGRKNLHKIASPGRTPDDGLAAAILRAHEENRRRSARSIAEVLSISAKTVCRYLRDEFHMKLRSAHWVPHVLNSHQKAKRMEFAQEMLQTLEAHRETNFQHLYTGDETWLYYAYYQRKYWVAPWEELEEIPRPSHHQKKQMYTVFFNGIGQYVGNFLPEHQNMNSPYFCEEVITPLAEMCYPNGIGRARYKVTVHFDNAPIHNTAEVSEYLQAYRLTRMQQPPYSPDLAPCDFFLFGDLKRRLAGNSFETLEDLSSAVDEILTGISAETFTSVFEDWIRRLHECVQREGEYVE